MEQQEQQEQRTWPRCFLVLENRVGCNSQHFALHSKAAMGVPWWLLVSVDEASWLLDGDGSQKTAILGPAERNLGLGIFLVGTESVA